MENRKPLFIYDCEGTLQAPAAFVYGLTKKCKQTNLSLPEFRAQNPEPMALLPGMADLVRYTATFGNNVLLSDGRPDLDGCQGLFALKDCFKNWQFEGKDAPWGRCPNNMIKACPTVAKALLQTFHPSWILVVGDSVDDYMLAEYLAFYASQMPKADINYALTDILFLKRGMKEEDSCIDTVVPLVAFDSGIQMKQFVEEFVVSRQKQLVSASSLTLPEHLKRMKLLAPSK